MEDPVCTTAPPILFICLYYIGGDYHANCRNRGEQAPKNVGHLPPELNGLIQQEKAFEQLTIDAAVKGDKQQA